jgi:LAO/AO transport system kinase
MSADRTDDETESESEGATDDLAGAVLDGDQRALARAITRIENRAPGHRDLVAALSPHAGDAAVIGITGSPGAGKSTLVDRLALAYRDRGETVGVIAVDPSSPYTGGAVLGDRIRMGSTVGDMEVFVRSMSARGTPGGLATATGDAVTALDASGKDVVIVETVGAGQNEVDVVRTADTVVVLVQPGAGDDVQTLKAGILEIGDVFVVNKADLDGAAATVADLREMLSLRDGSAPAEVGHHGATGAGAGGGANANASVDRPSAAGHAPAADGEDATEGWEPPVLETVATRGEGVEALCDALADHRAWLRSTGRLAERARRRHAAEIRRLLRADVTALLERDLERRGGVEGLADAVRRGETDPYTAVEGLLDPLVACLDGDGDDGRT